MRAVISCGPWTGNSRASRNAKRILAGLLRTQPSPKDKPQTTARGVVQPNMLNLKNAQLVRPLNLPWLPCFFLFVLLVISVALAHSEPAVPRAYDSSAATVLKISGELYQALDASKRRELRAEPLILSGLNFPCIAPVTDGETHAKVVAVSSGFIEWINHLAHAKALDEAANGYFEQYVRSLPQDGTTAPEPVGKSLPSDQVWNFDTMNHQVSLFNQMTGALLAIDMAHHYLGHHKKHGPTTSNASVTPQPIAEKLAEKEWHDAVIKGAKNALDCGLGVDGFRAILMAIERMPTRPKWCAYFVHPKTDTSKLSRELEKLEKDFFLVEK